MKATKTFMAAALAFCLMAGLAPPAHALQYTLEGTASPNYGKPTSVEVVQTPDGGVRKNEDISKNASLIPPTFGSPTSIPSGQYLNYSRIESGQFNTSVVVFELPGDFYTFRITSGRPSTNLLFKTIQIRKWLS